MRPSDLPPDTRPPLAAAFVQAVRQGIDGWLVAALDRAVERLGSASHQQRIDSDSTQIGAMLLALRQHRLALVQAVAQALREQLDEAPAAEPAAAPRRAGGELRLTLISESQIDDEIETARIVQLIESEAEPELQALAALCSGLLGRPAVEPQTVPLRPVAWARALRDGVARVAPEAPLRRALLRTLGQAVGEQMRSVYAEQVQWLQRRGVQEAAFRIRATATRENSPTARLAMLAVEGLSAPDAPPAPADSMRELVQWARRAMPAAADDGGLRLLATPVSHGGPDAALPLAAAEELMRGLFAELQRQSGSGASMGELLGPVERLARRVAAADPTLWTNPSHPWWQLLDRLLAAGAVHDDLSPLDQRVLRRSLDHVVQQVESEPRLDADAALSAADELQSLASRLLESAAAPEPAEVDALQREADREELELAFRNQIVQQLRSTPTSGPMRRFLVGPWTQVLVTLALLHGAEGAEVAAAALVVDDLIRATARPGQRVSKAQRTVLLRQVGDGLARTTLAAPRIDAELAELADILRDPPPHPEDPQEAWQEEPIPPLPLPVMLDLHAGLPTVPLALPDGGGEPRPTAAEWAVSLQPGALCRLFLQSRWMTVRLNWVGPGQRLFLFQSRHGGRSHSLTQRMLCKLREAGLATSIDDNLLRAQAMDSLVRHTVV